MTTLCSLFIESAERFPDREAIVLGDSRINYRTLSFWAESIAVYLREHGLNKGDRVAVLVQNSLEYAAIYYGVLAAGGVVIGLNTANKARDLVNLVRHSDASWLFAESGHPELKPLLQVIGSDINVVEVGEPRLNGEVPSHINLTEILRHEHGGLRDPEAVTGNDLAAIIYTSGTTGHPKGVMLSHQNLFENIRSILEYLELQYTDSILNVLPFYYSYGNSVLHTHLAVGGKIVLENSMLYPHRVMERLVEEKVSGFSGVPSTFALLLNRTKLEDYDLSSIRYLTQAGGAMAPTSIKRLRKLVPKAEFLVMYGQTEASARLSYLPSDRLEEKMGSIGIPIPGVTLDIRGEDGRPLVSGETGEIWASGDNIMQGYWKDPEMTATVLQDGWLKTGDLAYRDEDGFIYIVGRSSEMIKSGAHRISPKEIEEVILELDGIEEVAVLGVSDELLGQVIKAVVVVDREKAPDKRALQAHCHKNLASYKIPKLVEFVDEIPKTASGKVRRFMLQKKAVE